MNRINEGIKELKEFKLIDALFGRRSRRVFMGAKIPDGYFKYTSPSKSMPLTELEKMVIVTSMMGNTGWHNLIMRGDRYAPDLSNYAGSAGGRTFPSAAGFQTVEFFYTDDEGVYFVETRDAPALIPRKKDGLFDFDDLIESHKNRIRKIQDTRLDLPPKTPYIEDHNTWVVNKPGTVLFIPIGDLAQHILLNLCYMLQNGIVLTDDINKRPIPGISRFSHLVDVENVWPISFVEQWSMSELTAELATSCYAGMLVLQAMGLGGWMFNGIDPHALLGASDVKGLGFRYDESENWATPNVTGLPGIFEAYTPPHVKDMKEAVETLVERKFGDGGPFNPKTPGYYKNTGEVRASAKMHDDDFKACVSLQAQYVFDTFGKFPGIVPSVFVMQYLQAHHLDTGFYDKFYKKGAYLETHSNHMARWH